MRNVSRGASLVAVLAALSLGVAACGDDAEESPTPSTTTGGGASAEPAADELKFGFMGALSGSAAQLGINIKNGAALAIEQYNATNPATKITLTDYDTAGDPAQATSLAPALVNDGVVAVIGPAFSGESKVAVPRLEEGGIPNISASATNAQLSENGWKFWHRVLANDDVQGPGVAEFTTGTLGAAKIAVVDDKSEYGLGLADVFASTAGDAVVERDSIEPTADDYSSTVNKIKGAGVDAIFYGGYYAEAAKFIKQLRDAGVDAQFVSADGTLDQKFIDGAGDAAEGAFLSCTCVLATASEDPAVQEFIDAYTEAYGGAPATYSAEGYDAATAFIEAVKAGSTTPEAINEFIATVDFKGISKPIKFNEKGELTEGSVYMHQVKDGAIIAIGDYESAQPQ